MTQILRNGHELKSMQQFPGILPTAKQQVICCILNEDNFLKSRAANTMAQELFQLWTWSNVCTISKDCDFHDDQKITRDSQCTSVTEKLTPSEVKFQQKILYSYAPTISKRSGLDSDVVAKAGSETLFDDKSDYGPSQCSSQDLPLQIDDEDLHHNRSK